MTKKEMSKSEYQNISRKNIREPEYQIRNLACPDTLPTDLLVL
jgi:hypothetical protein